MGTARKAIVREVFRRLASAPAMRIVLALDQGPATVAEVAERARMRWFAAYKALRSLEAAGLVEAVGRGGGRGRQSRYRLVRPALGAAVDLLADLADTTKAARDGGAG